uniref:Uncharacterized protein n=1 Tax=Pararge aegeria TaxID=116150 RepID=S4P6E6_9NEOP
MTLYIYYIGRYLTKAPMVAQPVALLTKCKRTLKVTCCPLGCATNLVFAAVGGGSPIGDATTYMYRPIWIFVFFKRL